MIETRRLRLRDYAYDDFNALYEILSDPETMRYYPKPFDEAGTKRWIDWNLTNYKEYGFGLWAIELKDTGEFIGDCGLTMQSIDGETLPEIGYHINKKHWQQGYAKEAATAVRDWGFENTGFDALYSYMTSANSASCSTAISIGMKKIKEFTDERYEEMSVCMITRKEWETLKKVEH